MAIKYINQRINLEDFKKLEMKRNNLAQDIKSILGKDIKFPMTKFFRAVANGAIEVNPHSAVQYFKLKKVKL
jgi:hypothetical protein